MLRKLRKIDFKACNQANFYTDIMIYNIRLWGYGVNNEGAKTNSQEFELKLWTYQSLSSFGYYVVGNIMYVIAQLFKFSSIRC